MTPIEHYMKRGRELLKSSPWPVIERLYNSTRSLGNTRALVETALKTPATIVVHSEAFAEELRELGVLAQSYKEDLRGKKILIDASLLRELFHIGNSQQFVLEQILNWIELSRKQK